MNDDKAYVVSAANLQILEKNLNYLANNVDSVDVRVEDVNLKINKVSEDVKNINTNIKELINEIRETTILTNAKQSISLAQDEINKKYGHYDNIRRKISGLFQAIEIGSIDNKSLKEIKEKAIVDTPDYWLSSALVAICSWLNNDEKESINALKDAIKKDDEKTSLFFSLINLKFERYSTSFLWLKRYLDMQDSSKIENKIVPLLDSLSNGVFNEEEKEYFLNKIFLWTNELSTKSNYKNIQINRWVDFLIYLLGDKKYDEYYYVKHFTNKYDDIIRITNINLSQKYIYDFFFNLINEKEQITLDKKDQIDKIINLLIYNYENDELDLRKDIAKNKLIIEENGNTTKAKARFKTTEFAYLKNTDFYSLLTNIILQSNELNPSINTKKLSLSLLKNLIINSYNQLNTLSIENMSIMIKINDWTSFTTDGSNEKELVTSLFDHIDKETSNEIESIKLFDLKMLFTSLFGLVFSIILFIMNQTLFGVLVILLTVGVLIYSLVNNVKLRNEKVKIKNERKKEEKILLLNIISEIVDFRFMYKDGLEVKDKIINLLKSLDYNNYIKTNNKRNINIEMKEKDFNFESKNNNTDLFDKENKNENKINPPSWDLEPPYNNVGMVNRI